jgi:hypothetical protein
MLPTCRAYCKVVLKGANWRRCHRGLRPLFPRPQTRRLPSTQVIIIGWLAGVIYRSGGGFRRGLRGQRSFQYSTFPSQSSFKVHQDCKEAHPIDGGIEGGRRHIGADSPILVAFSVLFPTPACSNHRLFVYLILCLCRYLRLSPSPNFPAQASKVRSSWQAHGSKEPCPSTEGDDGISTAW